MFRKVLLIWSSMPIFSFTGYTLTELFRKPDNWRQIYKQTSSTFYTSKDVWRRKITSTSNKVAKHFWSSHRSRTSHRRCSVKKGVLKNFASFTGKHLYWSYNTCITGLQPANFLKKRLQHKCFSVEFAKLLRTLILMNICKRLLLEVFYKAVLKNFAIFTGRR